MTNKPMDGLATQGTNHSDSEEAEEAARLRAKI